MIARKRPGRPKIDFEDCRSRSHPDATDRAVPASIDNAKRTLELASTAHSRFKNANSEKKRELLQFMLSHSSWVDGKLEVEMFEAFDLVLNLAETATQNENETV